MLMGELRAMVRSQDSDRRRAAVDFVYALKTMRAQSRMLASMVPTTTYVHCRPLLQPARTTVWVRESHQHSLYLTHIPAASFGTSPEVRAVLACNGAEPEPDRLLRASERHSQM